MRTPLLLLLAACADPPMPEVFDGLGTLAFACGPTDGPAVKLEVGLTAAACDATPADTQRVVITVYGASFPPATGDTLAFPDPEGGFGYWYAGPDDTVGEAIDAAAFTVLEDGDDGVRTGAYTFTRADGTEFEGGFGVVECDSGALCG